MRAHTLHPGPGALSTEDLESAVVALKTDTTTVWGFLQSHTRPIPMGKARPGPGVSRGAGLTSTGCCLCLCLPAVLTSGVSQGSCPEHPPALRDPSTSCAGVGWPPGEGVRPGRSRALPTGGGVLVVSQFTASESGTQSGVRRKRAAGVDVSALLGPNQAWGVTVLTRKFRLDIHSWLTLMPPAPLVGRAQRSQGGCSALSCWPHPGLTLPAAHQVERK